MPVSKPHDFWKLVNSDTATSQEQNCLLCAIVNLSVTLFKRNTLEEIYDLLMARKMELTFTDDDAVIRQLKRMEELLMATTNALGRVQEDQTKLVSMLTSLQAALAVSLQAQSDANARLSADIAALRNLTGSNDEAALNAVADSLETTLNGFQGVTDQLTAAAAAEAAVDPAPTATPAQAAPTAGEVAAAATPTTP